MAVDPTVDVNPSRAPATEEPELAPDGPERYRDLGALGSGGMGEVRRVEDPRLRRRVALKALRRDHLGASALASRFIAEAQVMAQLQHPGIAPVHELGTLPDGRPYFTMKEIEGRTLASVIEELHRESEPERWTPSRSGWTFRRVIDAFRRACEAVAYAHARGVLHRDLKPDNIMLGAFGETLVLDWGLARLGGAQDHAEPLQTDGRTGQTMAGAITGTPRYMSPEQARGAHEHLTPSSDVYALGAILYLILAGQPAYRGSRPWSIVRQVSRAQAEPLRAARPLPPELVEAVGRAMDPAPERRYPDAGGLASALADWLDGARRREQALERVAEADRLTPAVAELERRTEAIRTRARAILEPLRSFDPVARKAPGWALEEEARGLAQDAALLTLQRTQALYSALSLTPDLPEAHRRLADHFRAEHEAAETARDETAAARAAVLLQSHDREGRHTRYLAGEGALSLTVSTPGARARLLRYVEQQRRLEPLPSGIAPGPLPWRETALPAGSWLVRIEADGHHPVDLPLVVERARLTRPEPLALPQAGALGPEDQLVPAGWFWSGGDAAASDGLPRRRVWLPAFVLRRFPVTHAAYLRFLNGLVAEGAAERARAMAPWKLDPAQREFGRIVYDLDGEGHYTVDEAALRLPVVGVDHGQASACAAWYAAHEGLPWQLPHELWWEKAARGVDGRPLPWGDHQEPTWVCGLDSVDGTPAVEPVEGHPLDVSPYGVRGLTGNVRDWCCNRWTRGGPTVVEGRLAPQEGLGGEEWFSLRGGAFSSHGSLSRPCTRFGMRPGWVTANVGFRLARLL